MPVPTVLIAEDDSALRFALGAFLRASGYVVIEAANGLEASRRLSEADIFLFDISLPEKSGIELLREVRRSRPGCPVALVSGRTEQYFESGETEVPSFVLRKPFDPEALLRDLLGILPVRRSASGG